MILDFLIVVFFSIFLPTWHLCHTGYMSDSHYGFSVFIMETLVLACILDSLNVNLLFRFFPVFSADAEKIADLQVSIVLESLMGRDSAVFNIWVLMQRSVS